MLLPYKWLADFVAGLPEPAVVAERLTMAGVEVEAVRGPASAVYDELVVADLVAVDKHPNADRLSVCRVADADGERTVVCGASNMAAGDRVVLARPGTVLPGGLKIKASKLRGVRSEGMLCSAGELGLPDDGAGIMILGGDVAVGAAAAPLLGLDDTILELGVTPNRGDCLSIAGLAREAAAVSELEASLDSLDVASFSDEAPEVPVEIVGDACTLYRGAVVRDVRIAPSPLWLQARLAACGLRPINNVVDVTNYVLFELGQPLHAFDLNKLAGARIAVRRLEDGSEFETLDGEQRRLLAGDVVIEDADGAVALAGVMGGQRTAVDDATTDVFLEAAVFDPSTVRRTSRRLGLVSDSSYRFERGIDAAGVERALARAAALLVETSGGRTSGGVSRAGDVPAAPPAVLVRPGRVGALLGIDIDAGACAAMLERLGVAVEETADGLAAVAPPHRHDLEREADYVEEIARLYGYDEIPTTMPKVAMRPAEVPARVRFERRLRTLMAGSGLSECVPVRFATRETNARFRGLHAAELESVRLVNPMRADEDEMARSPLGALVDAHATNVRNGFARVDLFTLSKGFAGGAEPVERCLLAGLLSGPRRGRAIAPGSDATFWDAKGIVERVVAALGVGAALEWVVTDAREECHSKACAEVLLAGETVGFVGKLHPGIAEDLEISEEICLFEVDTHMVLKYAPAHRGFVTPVRYPSSSRDVSLLVPRDTLAGQIVGAVRDLGESLIESIDVFDEYVGPGIADDRKALGFSLCYRSSERTLTDEEVQDLHERVIKHLCDRLDVSIRA